MIALAALTAILHRLINPLPCSALHAHMQRVDHDPAHVAWVGDDEYDLEATAILERLSDDMEAPEVAALVHDVFARFSLHKNTILHPLTCAVSAADVASVDNVWGVCYALASDG